MAKNPLEKILYRDGKPVTARPTAEGAEIFSNHEAPGHADYNPGGETVQAAAPAAAAFIQSAMEERRSKSKAGKQRRGKFGALRRLMDSLKPTDFDHLLRMLEDEDRIA